MATLQIYPVGQKFRRNRSILQGFRDISIFMFCNFCEKFENSKWPPFLARQKFFHNWDNWSAEIPCGSKISSKSLYLARFSNISIFMFCNFFENFENSKWPPFLARQKFFHNWDNCSAEIPCGSKISSKSLYLARFSNISIFVFCNFFENFENSKWPPFLARQNFFENWEKYSAEISCGSKILSKLLYLARFLRYKHFCVLQFLRKFRKFKMAAILGETKIF